MTNASSQAQRTGVLAHLTLGRARTWGVVGVMAQVVFTAGWVIAETWQGPSYGPIQDTKIGRAHV